jgi:cytochrome c5
MKNIIYALFVAITFFSACSYQSTPKTNSVPQQAATTFNMVTASQISAVEGEKIYNAKCGKCHDLKKTTDYTVKEWQPIMNSMANKAKLSANEKANVMAFVTNGAKLGK